MLWAADISRTNSSTTILSSNTRASDTKVCNTEPQWVCITSSFAIPTEIYPLASQNDLCYNGIYTGVLGSNRWSGWAAAISIFPLVSETTHSPFNSGCVFLAYKSTLVKRWDKAPSQAEVSLKDTKMGWILWLYKNKKPLSQSDVWIKFCTLSTGNMKTFPSIISSCKSFAVGLKGNNRCTQNKFSFLCWPVERKRKSLGFVFFFFKTPHYLDKPSWSENFTYFTNRLVWLSLPVKWGNEKKSKSIFQVVSRSPSESPYYATLLNLPHNTNPASILTCSRAFHPLNVILY